MTVEIERDVLIGAIRAIGDVVEARTTIPVLGHLLFEVADGELSLSGTDLNIMATTRCEAAGSLSTTIDHRKLASAASTLKPGRLSIVESAGRVTIKQGRAVRTLPTLPAADFPRRKDLVEPTQFTMRASMFARLLDTTHVAQLADETRPYLQGVYLHVGDEQLFAAASDGHRAIQARTPLPDGAAAMPGIIVPTKTVALLRKLLAKPDGDVTIAVTREAIIVTIGRAVINASLIDGTFPDYTRIIPAEGAAHTLIVMRDAVIEPVKAVAAISSEKSRAVRLVIDGANEAHEVTAQDMGGSSAVEPLDLEYSGDGGIQFGVNHAYLVGTAGVFSESGKLTIALADPAAPMRVTSDKDPDLLAVIMPMRV